MKSDKANQYTLDMNRSRRASRQLEELRRQELTKESQRLLWLTWTYALLALVTRRTYGVVKAVTRHELAYVFILALAFFGGLRFMPAVGVRIARLLESLSGDGYGTCDYYVDSAGTAAGDGSIGNPWSLDTALIKGTGGDTICVAQGSGNLGAGLISKEFVYQTSDGTDAEHPLVYRNYPGTDTSDAELAHWEWPVWWPDSGQYLVILGEYVHWVNFEFYFDQWDGPNNLGTPGDSSERHTNQGAGPSDIRRSGVIRLGGHGSKVIYPIMHDMGSGMGPNWDSQGDSLEVYGQIAYNNGYVASDGGHGPGAYISSDTVLAGRDSAVTMVKSIMFNNLGQGTEIYQTSSFDLGNITVDSNIYLSPAIRSQADSTGDVCIFVGGGRAWRNVLVRGNLCLVPNNAKSLDDEFKLGSITVNNSSHASDTTEVTFSGNYLMGKKAAIYDVMGLTWDGNTLVGHDNRIYIDTVGAGSAFNGWSSWSWDNTIFQRVESQGGTYDSLASLVDPARRWGLTQWQDSTGFDASATYNAGVPTDTSILVWDAGEYEDANNARGYITVLNWQDADSITVPADSIDLIIDNGDTYDIRHVNRLDSTIVSGTWSGGDIRLPMNNPDIPDMYGGNPYKLSTLNLAPTFNVFIIRKYWETGYQGWSQWASSAEVTFDTEASGDSTMNIRAIIYADSLDTNGDQVRVYFTAGDDTLHIDGASICVRSGSTDDCTTTPTRLYFNGGDSTGIVVPTSTTKVSDPLDYSIYADSTYLVHAYMVHPYKSYGFIVGSGTNGYSVSGAAAGDLTLTQTVSMTGTSAFGLVPRIEVRTKHEN